MAKPLKNQEKIEQILPDLEEHNQMLADLVEYHKMNTREIQEQINQLAEEVQKRVERMNALKLSAQEQDQATLDDIETVKKRIAAWEKQVKTLAHTIDPVELKEGLTIQVGKMQVKINAVEPVTVYDSQKLLKKFPHIKELQALGRPVVESVVNPDLLEILIEAGTVALDDVRQFKTVAPKRTPGVSIKIIQPDPKEATREL